MVAVKRPRKDEHGLGEPIHSDLFLDGATIAACHKRPDWWHYLKRQVDIAFEAARKLGKAVPPRQLTIRVVIVFPPPEARR